jgi:MFS family permease
MSATLSTDAPPSYRWRILALSTLTNILAVAAPMMALPVLFDEISQDLHLSLVQVGLVWGISALPGIITGLVGGALGDRIGPKRVILAGCLLTGLAGILRGLSVDFTTLAAVMFLGGMLGPLIPMNNIKISGIWFPRHQLGMANGVLSMGMAMGFLIGSMLSATLLSPWLGGWRQVMFLYGGLSILLCLPWYFIKPYPSAVSASAHRDHPSSLRQTVGHILRTRNIWLLGFGLMGIGGAIQGILGYLPLYLRGLGWSAVGADGALAAFHTISMVFVIPIALFSDKIRSRNKILLPAALMVIIGAALLSVADGFMVWVAVLLAGFVRDGFMAVFLTSVIETDGVGVVFAGTATGVVMCFSGVGNLLAPPLGNNLAEIAPGLPFAFWAFLAALGLISLLIRQEKALF